MNIIESSSIQAPGHRASAGLGRFRVTLSVGLAALAFLMLGTFAARAEATFHATLFDGEVLNSDGSAASQAGSHPYVADAHIAWSTKIDPLTGAPVPEQGARNISVDLPPGLIGNPNAIPTCTIFDLGHGGLASGCPPGSQVGVIGITSVSLEHAEQLQWFPLFNMVRPPGTPAAFGAVIQGVTITLTASIRSTGDYGVTMLSQDIPQTLPIHETKVILWGVPADASHDALRKDCLDQSADDLTGEPHTRGCQESAGIPLRPFLRTPTHCTPAGTGDRVGLRIESWQGVQDESSFITHDVAPNQTMPLGPTGCDVVPFDPAMNVQPQSRAAGAPTGLSVDLSVPQRELTQNTTGLAQADLKTATVTLPAGLTINPSAADGLAGCTDEQIGTHANTPVSCPETSKIADAKLTTPLLSEAIEGAVYLGTQQSSDPSSGDMYRIFLDLENANAGISVRLPGHLYPDPQTGQLKAVFDNNPQLPFEHLQLRFKPGPRAPLSLPTQCGTYTTQAQLTPWSGTAPVESDSSFVVDENCAQAAAFTPSLEAGATNPVAGAFSPFVMKLTREDAQQNIQTIKATLPPGELAKLAGVPLCPSAAAAAGGCDASSQIGTTTIAVGAGATPLYIPQPGKPATAIYLSGAYEGAPYSLVFEVPAQAGPFDLGTVVVRAAINIDPHTAQVTVTSDPLPQILKGVPVTYRTIYVNINRQGFALNPTNCSPLSVDGTITSTQGASAAVSSHFQAANCASLPFKPKFTVLTQAKTSKANGASLHVKVTSGAGQANIGKVKVDLPKQLPSRLTTLQKACPDAVFNANPAGCPAGSLVGEGTAATPILSSALRGPAYLVSHAGAAFPDLVIVLQGEGITLDLVGNTDIKKGITISTFNTVPDAPVSTFDLVLPQGPHSALAAYGNLCKTRLNMPTALTGQNGAQVKQTTRIAVSGCPKANKKAHTKRKVKAKVKSRKK